MTTPDLSTCDSELIHSPGSIQPHGFLLGVSTSGVIEYVTENIFEFTGRNPNDLLGTSIEAALDLAGATLWRSMNQVQAGGPVYAGRIPVRLKGNTAECDIVIHKQGTLWIIEGEPVTAKLPSEVGSVASQLASVLRAMERSRTGQDLLDTFAAETRRLTGFDRVLVYAFDADFNGTVVAENRNAILPSYLDLRFPASDIPKQARELYRLNPLRIIPNYDYEPVAIRAASAAGRPLDLTYSVLRSVSGIHRTYMRNMGTPASMSVSIMRDGALWGLISCHNGTPRMVPFRVREICAMLAQVFSLQLITREQADRSEEIAASRAAVAALLAEVTKTSDYFEGLTRQGAALLDLTGAAGVAVISEGRVALAGRCPSTPDVLGVVRWLAERGDAGILVSSRLAEEFPDLAAALPDFAGLLAIPISISTNTYILCFRPEVVTTVKWGGDPTKPASHDGGRLHPRHSFALWTETMRGRSSSWTPRHVTAAREMRTAIVDVALRHATKIEAMNRELNLMHGELETLSYSISHDIRGPLLRTIRFGELLCEELAGNSAAEHAQWAEKVVANARDCSSLLDRLLTYTQLGRSHVRYQTLDLMDVIEQVRADLNPQPDTSQIQWTVRPLPVVQADPLLLKPALRELVSNAIAFSSIRSPIRIEIGASETEEEHILYIRDNGVGFPVADVEQLFRPITQGDNGTQRTLGVGLAIVKRAMTRLHGRVWAEGQLEHGATFFLAMPKVPSGKSEVYSAV